MKFMSQREKTFHKENFSLQRKHIGYHECDALDKYCNIIQNVQKTNILLNDFLLSAVLYPNLKTDWLFFVFMQIFCLQP